MKTEITNINIYRLIIKTTWNFIEKGNFRNNTLNNIEQLLNALRNEAKYIENQEISNIFYETAQLIYQDHKLEDRLMYFLYYDIFATLVELYVKIIDAKQLP